MAHVQHGEIGLQTLYREQDLYAAGIAATILPFSRLSTSKAKIVGGPAGEDTVAIATFGCLSFFRSSTDL